MRVAIVHEWLSSYMGSERVVGELLACLPEADLFAVVDAVPADQRAFLGGRTVRTTFIQGLPFARSGRFRAYLPLMPFAIEQLDVSGYDVVVSSSHAVAKGVITAPGQLHLCYCHTPMRYAWDMQAQYLGRGWRSLPGRALMHYLRMWDLRAAAGVDLFLANSSFIARRIAKSYRRESVVVHPPVDLEAFRPGKTKSDFFVTAGRFVGYKRMDLIVDAFSRLGLPLVAIGDGPELAACRRRAGPSVKLLGYRPHAELVDHLQRARAFVFAGEEDFGIAPVEAQACGTPVIAFAGGGVVDSVIDGQSGVLFPLQSVDSVVGAVQDFIARERDFSPESVRASAERFAAARFRERFLAVLSASYAAFKAGAGSGELETRARAALAGSMHAAPLTAVEVSS